MAKSEAMTASGGEVGSWRLGSGARWAQRRRTISAIVDDVEKIRARSSCLAMVEVQETAETLAATDDAGSLSDMIARGREQDCVSDTLMVSLFVVMSSILIQDVAQGTLTKKDHLVQTFFLDGADEALGEGVKIGTPWREFDLR